MKQQLLICLLLITTQCLTSPFQEFSSRAVSDIAKKSYQQQYRMSDLQHKKEKKFARKRHIEERQAKRQLEHTARKSQIQSHSNRVNAQRTHADHHEKVRDSRQQKHRNRQLIQQVAEQKQTYINYEKNQIEQKINIHHAARDALRKIPN